MLLHGRDVLWDVGVLITQLLIASVLCPTQSTPSYSSELTQSNNLGRVEYLQTTCDTFNNSVTLSDLSSEQLKHILVDHNHKLLYCYVPKVACTNWKRILMILSKKWNGTNVLAIPASLSHSPGMFLNLGNVSISEREKLVENYQKLIFVRHPFERLLSAYRNKLEDDSTSATYFQKRVGQMIIKLLRPNASNRSLEKGNDVTFEEFIEFLTLPLDTIIRSNESQYFVNEHWESITRLCHPCVIKYTLIALKILNIPDKSNLVIIDFVDFLITLQFNIGKYETLLDDSLLALNSINASYVSFPRDFRTSGTAEKLKKYYNKMPLYLIRKIYEVYKQDFKLFNYNLQNILGFDLG